MQRIESETIFPRPNVHLERDAESLHCITSKATEENILKEGMREMRDKYGLLEREKQKRRKVFLVVTPCNSETAGAGGKLRTARPRFLFVSCLARSVTLR
jgi:hypothetical protein